MITLFAASCSAIPVPVDENCLADAGCSVFKNEIMASFKKISSILRQHHECNMSVESRTDNNYPGCFIISMIIFLEENMMKKIFLILVTLLALATGCAGNKVREENEKLRAELAGSKLRESELQLKLKQQEDKYEKDCKTVSAGFIDEIANGDFSMRRVKSGVAVNIADRLFFETGKAEIKPEGEAVLKKLAENLKKMPDKIIKIDGHTDNSPIRAGSDLSLKYSTNWELGAARAINVTRFLTEKCAVDPAVISASTYSMYQPMESNDTKKGKAKNRRIEIIVADKHSGDHLKPESE